MEIWHFCLFHVLMWGRLQSPHRSTQIWYFHLFSGRWSYMLYVRHELLAESVSIALPFCSYQYTNFSTSAKHKHFFAFFKNVWTCCNNVKGVSRTGEPTNNYQLNLQLLSALRSFLNSFSSLFICPATTSLFSSLSPAAGRCFQRKSCKKITAKGQTAKLYLLFISPSSWTQATCSYNSGCCET